MEEMRFDLRYRTAYRYAGPVSDNLNALRVRPATTATQRCEEFGARIDPDTRMTRHVDWYGTEVMEFDVVAPHERLVIDVRALVATLPPPPAPEGSWLALADPAYADAGAEFLLAGAADPPPEALAHLDELTDGAPAPPAAVIALSEAIPQRFEYRQGATYVGSTVADLLEAGAGVCQDYAHLALLLLRRRGIAARYVSGYLWAAPEGGGADSVEVQTHAWIEALLPAEEPGAAPVWVGVDPTNGVVAGERHVKIGHGRSYADVPPIKGVYRGPAGAELEAAVTMTRLDPERARLDI